MNLHSDNALSVAEARDIILGNLLPIRESEHVSVRDALGRVLAENVIAPFNVPPHDNSAMDGYALRHQDLSPDAATTLAVVGSAFAGRGFAGQLAAGQAVRIMTGAPVPAGADTIVPQEVAQRDGDQVTLPAGIRQGQNLRRAGEDLAEGSVALPAGRRCGPAEIGLLASLGITEVAVVRRLRVAFFSTGDELAAIGEALGPGQIYDSNRYTLHGMLTQLGCELIDLGIVRDTPEVLEDTFRSAARRADVILTSGGVSVGEADHTRELLGRLGEIGFWKLDLKPGRPMAFGRIEQTWIFGLPGNPVATMVTFLQIVRDALLTLGGIAPLPAPTLCEAISADAINKRPGRREFVRGYYAFTPDGPRVNIAGSQGSGILKSMSEANCFIVLAEQDGNVAAGDRVVVQPFHGLL